MWLWLRNGTLERSLTQVGAALVTSLHAAGLLKNDADSYAILVRRSVTGRCEVIIEGASRAEEAIFLEALSDVLGPVQNPRYLLVRQSWLLGRGRVDYHAVPTRLGARKDTAEAFQKAWSRRVGPSELVYTRTGAGRRALLRARVQSFAAASQRFFERRSVWM